VGLVDALKSMLGLGGGGASSSPDRGLYWYVRCNRCKDVVRVRINMANEVSELGDGTEEEEDGGIVATNPDARYVVVKGVVDSKCYRSMRLTVLFDGRKRELESSVEGGGEVVDQAAWEASQASKQRSGAPPS
jgi:hypothetical protein